MTCYFSVAWKRERNPGVMRARELARDLALTAVPLGSVEPALHLGTTVELILVATVWEMQPKGMNVGRKNSATCLP